MTAWPPRPRVLAEAAWALTLVAVLYLVLVATSVWGTYEGQRGRVDIETGERVPFDAGGAWADAFAAVPASLPWPSLWWAGTTASLLLLSSVFVLRAAARVTTAGLIGLAASAPLTVEALQYMIVTDGWGGGPAGLGLAMLIATPFVTGGVWAGAIALRRIPLPRPAFLSF